jgi:hypothetical protein
VTAAAFVAAVDDVTRFRRAHELEAHLGLVPREHSSGDTQHRGRITKAGATRVRRLLVQAAVSMLRCRHPRPEDLRDRALRIAARRGKTIARVALARRLAGMLFAMLRDGTTYRPCRARGRNDHTVTLPVASASRTRERPWIAQSEGGDTLLAELRCGGSARPVVAAVREPEHRWRPTTVDSLHAPTASVPSVQQREQKND